jgi:hypothetical protein
MALAEKHRSVIYAHFVETIGEEAAEAMLSQFPARDLDEPVTKEFVALTAGELRTEIIELRDELHTEITELRGELHREITELRGELHTEIAGLRGEMRAGFADVRKEMAEMGTQFARRVQVTIGIATGILGALAIFVR